MSDIGKTIDIPSDNYIFKVNAEGFHFSRKAFTYDEWQKIRDFAVKLREERLDTLKNNENLKVSEE